MKNVLSEFIGTFLIVFCGTGAVIINEVQHGVIGNTGIAITFGLTVMAVIHGLKPFGNTHFNPAVSVVFLVKNKISVSTAVYEIIFQCLGAITASGLLRLMFFNNETLGATIPAGSSIQSFVLEIVLTFFLLLVIVRGPVKKNEIPVSVAAGGVVLLEAMFAGPISGASMNPARSIGPALISGHTEYLWIYLFAPLIGAMIAVLLTEILSGTKVKMSKLTR